MTHRNDIRAGATLIALGVAVLLRQLRQWKWVREIESTDLIPVRSAPQGLVDLQGYAWPSEPVTAPLLQMPVAYCRIVIDTNAGKNQWHTVADFHAGSPFFLADKTGTVLVFPEKAEVNLDPLRVTSANLTLPQKKLLNDLLQIHAPQVQVENSLFRHYRISEWTLVAGSPMSLSGNLSPRPSNQTKQPYRGLDSFLQKIRSYEQNPVSRLSGVQGHGVNVRGGFRQMYLRFAAEATGLRGGMLEAMMPAPLPLVRPTAMAMAVSSADSMAVSCFGMVAFNQEHPLLIADCSRSETLARLRRRLPWKILGAALAIAGGVTLLAVQLGFRL